MPRKNPRPQAKKQRRMALDKAERKKLLKANKERLFYVPRFVSIDQAYEMLTRVLGR